MVFVPHDYTADKQWPVILYLHGSGGRGNDGKLPLAVGLAPVITRQEKSFPFITVFPQCEETRGRILTAWSPKNADGKRAFRILADIEQAYSINAKQRILTGWSMGAMEPGCWLPKSRSTGAQSCRFPAGRIPRWRTR